MGARSFISVLLSRILLPIFLLAASILRQNILSFIYFLLLLVSPIIRRNKYAFDGGFKAYILVVLVYSVLVCAAHVVFQAYLLLYAAVEQEHYGQVMKSCNGTLVKNLQWIGLSRLDAPQAETYHAVRLLLPDFVVLIISAITYTILKRVLIPVSEGRRASSGQELPVQNKSKQPGVIHKYVETAGELSIVILLGVSAAMMPSFLSVIYLVMFLGISVYWSLMFRFHMKAYGILKRLLFGYLILHMVLLYLCQLGPVQEWLDHETKHLLSRLLGLTPLFTTDCNYPWAAYIQSLQWPYFANPITLFVTYVVMSLDYSYHRDRRSRTHTAVEESPFRRSDAVRSSEQQLLTTGNQPNYESVGISPPISPERRPSQSTSEYAAEQDEADGRLSGETRQKVRKFWSSIYHLLMKNSYLLAFIAMVLWAVLYPSWTAFVFLIIGCTLWLFPNSRKASLIVSPLLVFYAVGLVIMQYVCSVNGGGSEYNSTLFFDLPDNYVVQSIGLNENEYSPIALILKMLFLACFCIVLRELRREKCYMGNRNGEAGVCMTTLSSSSAQILEQDDAHSIDNKNLQMIGNRIKLWFSKYWILAVYGVLLAMAIQEPYIYRLIYMVLFLFSAITFQLSYRFWRYTLRGFLIFVALYSVIAIMLVYVFSFHHVLIAFQNSTQLQSKWLADIGFDPEVNYQDDLTNVRLLVRLLVPAVLLITVMLQIHLFHKKFLQLTEPNNLQNVLQENLPSDNISGTSTVTNHGGFIGDIVILYMKIRPYGQFIFYSFVRILTIHMHKVVYIIMTYTVTREATAMGFVLLIILNFSMYFSPVSILRKIFILIAQFWVGIIILAKMLFQLRTVPKDSLMKNCTWNDNATWHNITPIDIEDDSSSTSSIKGRQDAAEWFGLRALPADTGKFEDSLPYYIGGYVVILAGLTILAIFKTHDYFIYKAKPIPEGVTFPSINYEKLDEKFRYMVAYLVNYAFVKFGLELCFITSVVVVFYRQDAAGALYVLLLGILLVLNMTRRRYVRYVWFFYLVTLSLILPAQYLSSLGLPPTLCQDYPWSTWSTDASTDKKFESLRLWLVLPDYVKPPDIRYLMADCVQLLFVTLQWQVFRMEGREDDPVIKGAGDNKELGPTPPDYFQYMTDFMDKKKNFGHVLMSAMFVYWFWLSIAILFITGTQNINFYCLGYLVCCFYFFWHGLDFTIRRKRKVFLRIWNIVLFYNFAVIMAKTWFQILGCVFLGEMLSKSALDADARKSKCYLPELFSIRCLNPQFEGQKSEQQVCGVSEKEAGLLWDILAFVALLIQRRVYMSTYFLIVLCEEKSQAKLASRGAQLISKLLRKRVEEQERDQETELRKISYKMERIKLRNRRLGGASTDNWDHFEVIRSADPSMFEDVSDDETTLADISELRDFDEDENQDSGRKANPVKMLVTAIDGGLDASLTASGRERQKAAAGTGAAAGTEGDQGQGVSKHKPAADEDSANTTADTFVSAEDVILQPKPETSQSGSTNLISQAGEQVTTGDRWFKAFIIDCIKWVIDRLNTISRDYRTVAMRLDKDQVKEKKKEMERMMNAEDSVDNSSTEQDGSTNASLDQQEVEWKEALEQKSLLYRFGNAIYLALIARTEFICYFFMFLCHIKHGNILSLPLPVAAILWGMLSLPRPAKTFWISVLTYVMGVVVVKYIFRFSFLPWNDRAITQWNDWRLLVGVRDDDPFACSGEPVDKACDEKSHLDGGYYATYELLVLLSVFIHRSVLKRYGLWRNEEEQQSDLKKFHSSIKDDNQQGNLSSVNAEDDRSSQLLSSNDSYQDNPATDQEPAENNQEQAPQSFSGYLWFPVIARWYDDLKSGKQFIKGDYYASMVLCDFVNFLISVFSFSSFGPPQNGTVQDYIQENRVPVPFLVLLLVQFIFIVVDRALYLKKSVIGKLIFHIILVIVVHVWIFCILPYLTSQPFNQNTAAQLWYFIKCVYFGLSAWQIKSGYSLGVLGNFLTTKYDYLNLVLFKAFMICPFLLELRCVMDWMWTDTSFSIGSWFTMEDIFSKLFTLKCFRRAEKEYPTPRARNRRALVKYGLGGFILVALLFIIWFPLVIFSFANTIYLPNPSIQSEVVVSIGGYQDILTVKSQESDIINVTDHQLEKFKSSYSRSPGATGFLDIYEARDIRVISLNGGSTAIWGITEPSKRRLLDGLCNGTEELPINVRLSFTRRSKKGLTAGTISTEYSYNLKKNSTASKAACNQINGIPGAPPVSLSGFLPRYLYLPATGQPSAVSSLHCFPEPDGCSSSRLSVGVIPYQGINMTTSKSGGDNSYWSIKETSNYSQAFIPEFEKKEVSNPTLFFVTFNQRVAPESVSLITGPGIIGLYIGMVFVIGQFVRSLTSGGSQTIMFDELPNVDRLMKLCKDLYFVRENGELALEEEMFAKLIYLYRSPEMLIKWTKRKVS